MERLKGEVCVQRVFISNSTPVKAKERKALRTKVVAKLDNAAVLGISNPASHI